MAASRVVGRHVLLVALGLAVAVLARRAQTAQQAEPAINVQFHGFTDSRDVTVLSPTVDFDRDFTDRTGMRLRFGVDAISSSSDSCIRCHARGANNQRTFVNGSLVRKYGDTSVSLGGEVGLEKFYQATTAFGSVSRTLNRANTTVAGGYSFSWNRPNLHPSEVTESQTAQGAYAAVTQTLTRSTIAQVGYEVSSIQGYQSNPFLRAMLNGFRVVGEAPEERLRQTFTARLRQALPHDFYAEADYRYYRDDWKLHATTVSVGLSYEHARRLVVTGLYRRHRQTGVFFYAPSYTGNPTYFTADFRLFPFDSDLFTGRLVFTPARPLFGLLPEGAAVTAQVERYRATTSFEAITVTTGIRVPLKRR